jgi:hypothetical protein
MRGRRNVEYLASEETQVLESGHRAVFLSVRHVDKPCDGRCDEEGLPAHAGFDKDLKKLLEGRDFKLLCLSHSCIL